MINSAHDRGMYIIVDIIVNHLANLYYFEGHPNSFTPFKFHTGEYRLFPRGDITYQDFNVDNTFYSTTKYGTVYGDNG